MPYYCKIRHILKYKQKYYQFMYYENRKINYIGVFHVFQ